MTLHLEGEPEGKAGRTGHGRFSSGTNFRGGTPNRKDNAETKVHGIAPPDILLL